MLSYNQYIYMDGWVNRLPFQADIDEKFSGSSSREHLKTTLEH